MARLERDRPPYTARCGHQKEKGDNMEKVKVRESERYIKYFRNGKLVLAVCKQEPKTAKEHMGWVEVYALAKAEEAL